jgi:hypothetical protein
LVTVADALSGAPPDALVDTSLRLRYDFEDSTTTVKDSSSRGMDGTLSDVAAWTANGRNGRGLTLSAPHSAPATQFVSLPNGVLTGVSDFTISTWIKVTSITYWARIYDFGNGKAPPDNRFMFLTLLGNTPLGATPPNAYDGIHSSSFTGANGSAETFAGTQTQLPLAVWKHVTITGSNGDRHLYIDGFPAGHTTGGATILPSEMEPLANNAWLGKSRFGDAGLDGTLDDFRIYNRVLSTPEIADLAWPQHDYSYFRFDETSGLTARDSSDNAVPAALVNSPTWATGRLGGAVNFAGGAGSTNGQHVVFGSSPLARCTTQLTISAWLKLHVPASQMIWSRVFDFGNEDNKTFIYLTPSDGKGMHFAMVSPKGVLDMVTPSAPVPGDDTWHHVAVTDDVTGLVTIYVDGAVATTKNVPMTGGVPAVKPGDFAATAQNWLARSRFGDAYLNGAIDDMRISCRAYTADEILSLSRP